MSAIENFKNLFSKMEFVAIDSWIAQDEDGFSIGKKSDREPRAVSIEDLLKLFAPSSHHDDWTLEGFLADIKDFTSLQNAYNECTDNGEGWSRLYEKNAYMQEKSEKERIALESAAAAFAAKYKTGGVNLNFLQKIEEKLRWYGYEAETWNSGECRAERYARSTPESYSSDNDYVSSKREAKERNLNNILSWVQNNLPLLWAKHEEIKNTFYTPQS